MSKPLIDRVAVTEFLVSAVALIFRRAQDGDFESECPLLIAKTILESVVLSKNRR